MTDSQSGGLEPTGVGPSAGGHLRASDTDRDQVATVLSTAYAEGRITKDEHDERLEQVLGARTFDDLVPLTADLVPAPAPPPPAPGTVTVTDTASGEVDNLIGIFGGAERKGRWTVRRKSQVIALFGGVDLDMREASFESSTVEMSGVWCFGGLDIKVPEGVEVRDQTVGIFGGSDIKVADAPPGSPVLVLKGLALFGGVTVRGPKPVKPPKQRKIR